MQPQVVFCDTQNYFYTMVPDIQQRTDLHVLSFWNRIQLQKHAFIVSKGEIEQLSLEQMMEENPHCFEIKYFDNAEEARIWLTE